ncbi:MAG TPA: Zn-dependent alcohol dehydrogenase [Dehalococcoidia bacterium]
MKAAVLHEVNKPMAIEDVSLGDPASGQVLVKTAAAGVCHSDLHFIDGSWPMRTPAVLGHEAAGVVERVGDGVTYVAPGDHVVLLFVPFCGACRFCSIGRPNLCQNARLRTATLTIGEKAVVPFLGMSAFAEYMVVPESALVKIREDMPLDRAALVGCGVMTGIGAAINTAKVEAGSVCAVIGAGGVGLNVIQGCALAGAERVIAIDMRENKLALARRFGATHTVDASQEDPVAKVKELTEGFGADYAFEAIGLPATITQAFDMVRRGGEAIVVGMAPYGSETTIRADAFLEEKVLRGCLYGSTRPRVDMPRLVDLYMAGKINLDDLISQRFPLEGINDAFDALRKGEVARGVIVF